MGEQRDSNQVFFSAFNICNFCLFIEERFVLVCECLCMQMIMLVRMLISLMGLFPRFQ